MSVTSDEIVGEMEFLTRCKVVRKLASGGMGDVFLAEQVGAEDFRKIVAIKTVRRDLLADERTKKMFISEAKLVADLIHENIMQVYNLCSTEEDFFLVMEYIKGITLSKFLKKHAEQFVLPDPEMSAFIISRVARALYYAHTKRDHNDASLGIVHRDVTPANIMIDTLGVVKLTDFGIAKAISMGTPDETKVLMGKYPYMSPEQVRLEGTDGRSDIYSLGLVFYEMLTGNRLYPAHSRQELLQMMSDTKLTPPAELNPDISKELSDIVVTMLDSDPENRFKTGRHLVLALERYMYTKGYGPTNEKLAIYLKKLFKK